MNKVLLFLFAITVLGCKNSSEEPKEVKIEGSPNQDTILSTEPIEPTEEVAEETEGWENGIVVKFQGVSVFMEYFDVYWSSKSWNEDDFLYEVDGDTAFMDLMPGDWMMGKRFKLMPDNVESIEVFQQEIIHVSIDSDRLMEVPLCVMEGWVEHKTEWQQIPFKQGVNTFPDDFVDTEVEFEFTLEDFMDAVESQCGEDWREEYSKYTSLEEVPYDYFGSYILYKFVLKSGEVEIVKYLRFSTPTSC